MATLAAHDESAHGDHALPYRRAVTSDLFKIDGEDCDEKRDLIAATDEYLSAFVAPVKAGNGEPACFHCGKRIDGLMSVLGVAVAYEWGLAHGEAKCSGCGWPARGMHYPKGADGKELWTASNLFLAYHPDQVTARSDAA